MSHRIVSIEEKQEIEINFWRDAKDKESLPGIVNKMTDAAVLLDCLLRYQGTLSADGRVIELGGGEGWASCMYKRMLPDAEVITTDISPYSIETLATWERVWDVRLDGAYACKSYDTREQDASVDLVFAFASAHHFLAHRRTLREIARILRPGGRALYLYDTVSPRWSYRLIHWHMNHKRPDVPEDVLLTDRILALAEEVGLEATVDYYPATIKRGVGGMLYFAVMQRLPWLQRVFPSTANFSFCKPKT